MRVTVAALNKKGEDAASKVLAVLKPLVTVDSDFELASPSTFITPKYTAPVEAQNLGSPIVAGCISPRSEGTPFVKLEDSVFSFEGRLYDPPSESSFTREFDTEIRQNPNRAVEMLLKKAEGDFFFILLEPEGIVAGRDPIGAQPLYYGENSELAAFASNRKVLWKLGVNAENVHSFPPGHTAVASCEGFKFRAIKKLIYPKQSEPISMQEAAETLQKLLEASVKMRTADATEVAVAFSGGLDSSIIAALAKKCKVDVNLIHISLEGQPETRQAKSAAEALQLPLQVYLFKEADIEHVAPNVVALIEESDPVKASIGVPFYWTAQKAVEAGFKVLLAGQGADELFGGYQRYVNDCISYGTEKVRKNIYDDAIKLYENNLERDMKLCGFHGVELRLPFASYKIAQFAVNLPVKLKVECKLDSLRKLVLRKMAKNMNLPATITEKPKKAMQYSTGINAALKKIAKNQKLSVNEYIKKLFFDATK